MSCAVILPQDGGFTRPPISVTLVKFSALELASASGKESTIYLFHRVEKRQREGKPSL